MKKLTINDFANKAGVSHDMVTRLVKQRVLKGSKKNPFARTSPILIPESELLKFLRLREKDVTQKRST